MNTFEDLKKIVLQNIKLLFVLIILSVIASFIHYKYQPVKYSSSMMTSNGKYDAEYLKEMISFNNIDTSQFNLPNDVLKKYDETLSDISIQPIVGSGRFITLNLLSNNDNTSKKTEIEDCILDLMNHNKLILSFRQVILRPHIENLEYINNTLSSYQMELDSLSTKKSSKKYIRLERRIYNLQKEKIEIDEKVKITGQYFLLSPSKDFKIIKKPILLFVFLYLFLAGVIFILVSNKKIKE